jgi:hypothetical protein
LNIYPLMCAFEKVWTSELTLIHKNIRSFLIRMGKNWLILKIIGQCDVKHIFTSPIKTITPVMKISTNIVNSTPACPLGLDAILAIMSVSTFNEVQQLYSITASLIGRAMILVIMYVETFKIDVIVFISIKRHNATSHWPIFSSILVTKLMLAISHQRSYIKLTNQRWSFQILIYCKPSIRREMSYRSIYLTILHMVGRGQSWQKSYRNVVRCIAKKTNPTNI